MGGLGPGIGGMEYLVIAVVALLVVGPERLPALLNKLGKLVARARNMANEFRSSFDEMARQSELDDLRKEVEALRHGQTNMMPLGADAEATFRGIRDDLNKPLTAPAPASAVLDEWPDSPPVIPALEAPAPKKAAPRKPRAKAAPAPATAPAPAATEAKARAVKKKTAAAASTAKPRVSRKKAVEL